jgi:general L-amino acid transport system substrate-binding protein
MMMLMMTAALAGCAGSDQQDEIDALETQATADAATIATLEAAATADAATIAGLEAGNTITQADVDAARAEGVASVDITTDNAAAEAAAADAAVAAATKSTLDVIHERGSMKCGVKESQYGMGYLDSATGVRSGLDISYCRALAAAIGLNPDTGVEYIAASAGDRFEKLASGNIDVLIRTTTWTTSRDAELNADFAGMNFFDGQGILVRGDAFPQAATLTATALSTANVCVGTGTTTEGNLADFNTANSVGMNIIGVVDAAEGTAKLIDGSCDAFTGDMSAMVAKKWQLDTDGSITDSAGAVPLWIAPEILSKEPLGAATRDNDDDWNDVVAWVWYGMVTAEEFGITSTNYAAMATAAAATGGDPGHNRLLSSSLGLGTTANPLSDTWMQAVLAAVGNYGEAYDDAFCDGSYDGTSGSDAMVDCLLSRAGTANALVSEGGLQFAPPMR